MKTLSYSKYECMKQSLLTLFCLCFIIMVIDSSVVYAVDPPPKGTQKVVKREEFPSAQKTKSTGQSVMETRVHTYWRNRRGVDPIKGPFPPGPFPRSTVIFRQFREDRGTVRSEGILLLETKEKIRIVRRANADYFLCKTTDELTISWSIGDREYIRTSETLIKCPDFTEESYARYVQQMVAAGKPIDPEDQLITVETKSVKVTIPKSVWKTKGDSSVLESLSFEFAKFATDELIRLSRVDNYVRDSCVMLAGLYSLDCGDTPMPILKREEPNCDFDASFGEPCTTEQKRAFEDRKARESMVTPSTLPTVTPSSK